MYDASLCTLSMALLLVPLVSCGVGDGEKLFGESSSGTTGGQGSGASGATSSSSDGGASSNAGGSPSGPGPSSSTSSSATATATATASSSSSSSSGGMDFSVGCGATECPVDGQGACCWDYYQLNPGPQGECVKGPPDGDECDTEFHERSNTGAEARIECQLPSHCGGGEVCCGDRVIVGQDGAYYAGTECATQCDDPDRILCSPLEPSFTCPVGTFCNPSTLLPPGYFICTGN